MADQHRVALQELQSDELVQPLPRDVDTQFVPLGQRLGGDRTQRRGPGDRPCLLDRARVRTLLLRFLFTSRSPGERILAGVRYTVVALMGTSRKFPCRPTLLDRLISQLPTGLGVLCDQQRPSVSLAQLAGRHELENLLGQFQQAHHVCDLGFVAAQPIPELLKAQTELLLQCRAGAGLLHRVEILAFLARHALDQRRFDLLERLPTPARPAGLITSCSLRVSARGLG